MPINEAIKKLLLVFIIAAILLEVHLFLGNKVDAMAYKFSHPMTVINNDELNIIKQRIANKTEPQYSEYYRLIESANNKLSFVPNPPDNMHIIGGDGPDRNLREIRDWLRNNRSAAYTCALAWAYSRNGTYAE